MFLTSKIKLLISVWEPNEVKEALDGGADIIDVKDPSKGSLGAPKPKVIEEVLKLVNDSREVSVAIGDVSCCPSTIRLASYLVSSLKLNYLKVGLNTSSTRLAYEIAKSAKEGVDEAGSKTKIVLVGYADYVKAGVMNPLHILDIAYRVEAHGVMIDTIEKKGLSTLNYLSRDFLRKFVTLAHDKGLFTALAGGLKKNHISVAVEVKFDIVGFRTAACNKGRLGKISKDKVSELKRIIDMVNNNVLSLKV